VKAAAKAGGASGVFTFLGFGIYVGLKRDSAAPAAEIPVVSSTKLPTGLSSDGIATQCLVAFLLQLTGKRSSSIPVGEQA
jgi:hypothetical protein